MCVTGRMAEEKKWRSSPPDSSPSQEQFFTRAKWPPFGVHGLTRPKSA